MLHQLAVVRIIRAFLRCNLHRLFVETPFKNLRSLHRAQGAAIRRRTNKSIRILHFNRIFHQRAKRGSSISPGILYGGVDLLRANQRTRPIMNSQILRFLWYGSQSRSDRALPGRSPRYNGAQLSNCMLIR